VFVVISVYLQHGAASTTTLLFMSGSHWYIRHLSVSLPLQISVNTAVVLDNSTKVKDLQRESYFINLERKRKLGKQCVFLSVRLSS